ncbi:MAG: BrnA antitoxin family protein [Candidatus Kerfeldbacteria bacterium]|nr:BrnA antitoxin family protein [Candidatus Kerfeldbacteria bacterium]
MKKRKLPKFKNEQAEAKFWQTHDSSVYIDWLQAQSVRLPHLKPSATTISLRLPISLLDEIKILANKKDVPYQSLIKVILTENVQKR